VFQWVKALVEIKYFMSSIYHFLYPTNISSIIATVIMSTEEDGETAA
jgi:hypothetical protein